MDRNRILITGGLRGIGAAIAERSRKDGYEVIVVDRDGGDYQADLSDPVKTAEVLEQILQDGPVTRLVNNVGRVLPATTEEQTLQEFDMTMALNLRCAMQCTQALLPGMKENGFGRIVNIASRAALGKVLRTAYSASKAGMIAMSKTWALELSRYGITSNAVGPGPIATELFAKGTPDTPERKAYLESIPVGRIGTPEDVAHACAFFLHKDSSFVTGQVLYVCGGITVGLTGN